jgi:hypothetical protein
MKKSQVMNKLEHTWDSFHKSFAGLTDEQMLLPGVTGDWTVKDILAHVTWWEEEALKHLPRVLQGERPPRYSVVYGGIDAFNALMREQRRDLPLAEVFDHMLATHTRLVEYLQSAPEEQFTTETRFRRRLRLDTYSHYPIHTRMIHEWRAQLL